MKTAKVSDNYEQVIELIANNATQSLKMYLLLIKSIPDDFKALRKLLEDSGIIMTAIPVTGRKVIGSKKRDDVPVGELDTEDERYQKDDLTVSDNTYSLYLTHRGNTTMIGVAGKESWFVDRGFVFV